MTRTLRALTLAASALALLGVANPASAGMETFSFTATPQAAPFSVSFSLPSFDPAQGMLTGITITTMEFGSASVSVINNAGTAQAFTGATASFPFSVTGPAGTSVTSPVVASVAAGTVAANSTANFPGLPLGGATSVNVDSSRFSAFLGAGGAALGFTTAVGNGTYSGSGPAGLFFGGSGSVGGSVAITYTFTASAIVPEPASLGLVALGLGGIAALGRLRGRRAA